MENQITTRAATKQVRMQHWVSVFRDRTESGLTVNEYCEQHSITKDSYYYWLREVRKAAIQSAGPVFAELKPPASTDREIRFQAEMEIQIKEACIRINRDTPESLLARTIRIMKYVE